MAALIDLLNRLLDRSAAVLATLFGGAFIIVGWLAKPPTPKWNGDELDLSWLNVAMIVVGLVLFVCGIWGMRRLQGFKRLPGKWRPNLAHGKYVLNARATVCHRIDPGEYSQMAKDFAGRKETKSIFTICRIEPNYFVIRLTNDLPKNSSVQDRVKKLKELGDQVIITRADSFFQHFEAFRTFCAAKKGDIHRVILATDPEWLHRNAAALDVFRVLNGEIPCFVASLEVLRAQGNALHFLTDHVVFNSEMCMDYYDESETLILTHAVKCKVAEEFSSIEDHFKTHSINKLIYKPLQEVIEELSAAVPPTP